MPKNKHLRNLTWPIILVLSACGGGESPSVALEGPLAVTQNAVLDSDVGAAQVSQLSFSTNASTVVDIVLDDGNGHGITINYPEDEQTHNLVIMGLRPNRTYSMSVVARTANGNSIEVPAPTEIITDPLPADFPILNVLAINPDRMEKRYTILDTRRKDRSTAYTIILDEDAQVVWYHKPGAQSSTDRLKDGNYLLLDSGSGLIVELDESGREVISYHSAQSHPGTANSIAVDARNFHHDVVKIEEEGRYLTTIHDDTRLVENFPIDEFNSAVTDSVIVRDEPIIEIDENGNILNRWSFLDMLKPTRIGYGSTTGLPNQADWLHVNGIAYDAATDLIYVSARHQDAVIAFARATGELRFIIGPPENWEGFEQYLLTPLGANFKWAYHMHAPEITATGTLLMFDNGNFRASPFTGQSLTPADANYSRAVEYSIDQENMTISQVWEWGLDQGGEALYAAFVGDADRTMTQDNTLITFGGLCTENGVASQNLQNCRSSARIIEVDTTTGERLFDLSVEDPDPMTSGYVVYRAERQFSLYSNNQITVTPTIGN